ncbi:hypothetical protein EV643_10635 [Kribbella sp. VKM Ac-2527]|uniref:Uncharacterized protein n=1 Tax=Kribbella caucasensis TaxID=2512215 RepID=A0A4R6KFP9_9ACTN|nr:hypothetical protein [Kribbella sp. VKM Ac-2527]TDO49066.1 hypothetical protein EV643_10635 [Kribbella sp. VKM Ac-2527]
MDKPKPLLGIPVGLVVGWLGTTVASYAGAKVNVVRTERLNTDLAESLPWVVLLLVAAAVMGLLMAIRAIGAGVMVGAGGLMAAAGLAVQVLPIRTAIDLARLFDLPGQRPFGYIMWDGSVLFFGMLLLVAGIGRWISDARRTPKQPQQIQDTPNFYPGYPTQPQHPGYPAQQPNLHQPGQQPGLHQPGRQQPAHPGQQQPGQHQPGQQHPGQQQPGQWPAHPGQQPPGQQSPGQHPGQQNFPPPR